jgi:putative nucleotidyltransferase with HDIG domain
METLAATVDADDRYTAFHSRQVALYAVELARKLGLPEAEVNRIRKGALLHDIGKIGVKDTIVSKESKLTAEEYSLIKRHPLIGAVWPAGDHPPGEIPPRTLGWPRVP